MRTLVFAVLVGALLTCCGGAVAGNSDFQVLADAGPGGGESDADAESTREASVFPKEGCLRVRTELDWQAGGREVPYYFTEALDPQPFAKHKGHVDLVPHRWSPGRYNVHLSYWAWLDVAYTKRVDFVAERAVIDVTEASDFAHVFKAVVHETRLDEVDGKRCIIIEEASMVGLPRR